MSGVVTHGFSLKKLASLAWTWGLGKIQKWQECGQLLIAKILPHVTAAVSTDVMAVWEPGNTFDSDNKQS